MTVTVRRTSKSLRRAFYSTPIASHPSSRRRGDFSPATAAPRALARRVPAACRSAGTCRSSAPGLRGLDRARDSQGSSGRRSRRRAEETDRAPGMRGAKASCGVLLVLRESLVPRQLKLVGEIEFFTSYFRVLRELAAAQRHGGFVADESHCSRNAPPHVHHRLNR